MQNRKWEVLDFDGSEIEVSIAIETGAGLESGVAEFLGLAERKGEG